MGNFHFAVNGAHLVNCLDFWGEAAVNAQDFLVDEGSEGEIVEGFIEVLPGGGAAVLFDDLIVEAIDGGDLSGLVVASQQYDFFGVLEFIAEEELDGLN